MGLPFETTFFKLVEFNLGATSKTYTLKFEGSYFMKINNKVEIFLIYPRISANSGYAPIMSSHFLLGFKDLGVAITVGSFGLSRWHLVGEECEDFSEMFYALPSSLGSDCVLAFVMGDFYGNF